MRRPFLIDIVQQGSNGGCFAAAGGSANQDQP